MKDLMKPKMGEFFAAEMQDRKNALPAKKAGFGRGQKRLASKATGQKAAPADGAALPSAIEIAKGLGEQAFKKPALVGTFHKTGTMLMMAILKEFCRHAKLRFWNAGRRTIPRKNWSVGFDWWSDFGERGLDPSAFPTALIIRDPRNVIVSSMKFHCLGKEPWLLIPDEALGGKTYQQALLDLPSDEERFLFEISHQGGATIADMIAAKRDPAHARSLFMPLETLMSDRRLGGYSDIFRHLGLAECYMPLALSVAYKHSVFNPAFQRSGHITSGQASVWRTALSERVLQALEEAFPSAAAELGYED